MKAKSILKRHYIVNEYGALFALSKSVFDVDSFFDQLSERNFYFFETLEDSIKKQSEILVVDEEILKKGDIPFLFISPHDSWCILFDGKMVDVGEKDIGMALEHYHYDEDEFYDDEGLRLDFYRHDKNETDND